MKTTYTTSVLNEKLSYTEDNISGGHLDLPTEECEKLSGKEQLMWELNYKESDLVLKSEEDDEYYVAMDLDKMDAEDAGYYTFYESSYSYTRGEEDSEETCHWGGIFTVRQLANEFDFKDNLPYVLLDEYGMEVYSKKAWALLILGCWEMLKEKDFNELDEDDQEEIRENVKKACEILKK